MKIPRNLGMILLGIWLVATGVLALVSLSFPGLGILMAILAIASGVLLLFGK
jgi:hypothetical protein